MCSACAASESLGLCDPSISAMLKNMLSSIGLPTRVRGLPDTREILERMGHDKKAAGGSLRVILPVGSGECSIVSDADASALRDGIDSIRS
jgi:3-dehydroquinate synthetase